MMQKVDSSEHITPKMLFDGDESEFYKFRFDVQIENQNLEIKASDFYSNSFVKLTNELREHLFQQILLQSNFEKNEELVVKYLGTESLQVYYCFKDSKNSDAKFLFIFSFGEVQPTRFRIYLEGMWKEQVIT